MSLPNIPNSVAFDPFQNAGNWNEPKTPYGKVKGKKIKPKNGKTSTIYPFNKVYESESGHIIEVDDTPGSERLHQFHRSGTFQEMHPNGDKVTKVVRDNYTSVLRDDYIHIDGNQNLTVDKALKILVNADKQSNTPGRSTNFDIEVGDNANINIIVNKGNCNLRLKNGDANVLINRGDVNIRQEAGNYNHFVNGDYNLEVGGHMHVVVGEDYVNEIGGCRDIRVDGIFDHLFVTSGYKETQVPFGSLTYNIGLNKQENILGEHLSNIGLGRFTHIGGIDETTVLGLYTLSGSAVFISGTAGASIGSIAGGGMDVTEDGRINITCPTHYSITAPIISLTSLDETNIYSVNDTNISGLERLNLWSVGTTHIGSIAPLSVTSGTSILQSAPQIHLNGPPAIPPIPSKTGLTNLSLARLTPELLPTKSPYTYEPGAPGVWRRTVNGITPLTLVRTSIPALKAQLAVLDTAANTVSGLQSQSNGLINSLKTITEGITSVVATVLSPITETMNTVMNTANEVVDTVNGVVDDVTDTINGVTNAVQDVAMGAVSELTGESSAFSQIKGALQSITGFIGDVVGVIADIACFIADQINNIIKTVLDKINSVLNDINEAIQTVLKAIQDVIAFIQTQINKILKIINDIINGIFGAVGDFINGILNGIASIFEGLGRPIDCAKSLQEKTSTLTSLESLAEQFANGDISEEDYDRAKSTLETIRAQEEADAKNAAGGVGGV